MDLSLIEEKITPSTRAILPVHLFGQMVDMTRVREITHTHDLIILEDAAQSHGARFKDLPPGAGSNAAAFSFYPGKNLGAYGDGGAVVTNDPKIEQRIRSLRFYGIEKEGRFSRLGYNSRLDEIQCAVLRVKLNHLSKWTKQRILIAEKYHKRLNGLPLTLPNSPPGMRHVHHLFVIRTPQRDAFIKYF